MGSCGGSTYVALHRTWLVSAVLPRGFGAQVGVSYFPVRLSARLHGALFVSFPDSCVSIPHFYLGCSSLDSCLDEWLGGLCPPPLSSRILSFEWSYSPDSLILLHPAIDFVAVSLSLAYVCSAPWPLCSAWCSSRPGWLLNLSLAGLSVGAFLFWTLAVLEAGLPSRPLLALPRLCLLLGL